MFKTINTNIFQFLLQYIFVIGLFIPFESFSQIKSEDFIFNLQHWTKEDGLPTWSIFSYLEDKKGQLWFGTSIGLVSFDGYEFKLHYKTLPGNPISLLREDNEGNIWTTLFHEKLEQIKYYVPSTGEIKAINNLPELNKGDNYRLFIHNQKALLYNSKGLFFDTDGNKQFSLPFNSNHKYACFPSGSNIWVVEEIIDSVAVEKKLRGNVYFYYHIYLYKKDGTLLYTDIDTLPKEYRGSYFWEKDKHLFSINQLGRFNKEEPFNDITCSKYTQKGKQPFSLDRSYFGFQHGVITYKSLAYLYKSCFFGEHIMARLISNRIMFYHKGQLIDLEDTPLAFLKQENTVNIAFMDKSGAFWISNKGGLYKIEIKKNKFRQYISDDIQYSTRGITIDDEGSLLVHTYKGTKQLNIKTKATVTKLFKNYSATKNGSYQNGLMMFKDGEDIWMGQHGSLTAYLLRNDSLISHPFFPVDNQRIYHMLRIGNTLWVGTQRGLYQIDKINQRLIEINKIQCSIYYLHENERGIWAATNNGLYLFDKKGKLQKRFLGNIDGQPLSIKHLSQDSDGTFWLATANGLLHWQPNNDQILSHFTTSEGLSDNNIHAVYGDTSSYLWLSSDYGLMCFHKATQKITTYLEKDGITNSEFNYLSHYQAEDEQLFFGGITGVTAFYPKLLLDNQKTNKLHPFIVSGEITNGKSGKIETISKQINQHKQIKLSTAQNFLTFNLTSFLLNKNPEIDFGWQLGNHNMVIQKDRTIRITNVEYGRQKLHIKVREVGQNWSEQTLTIDIYRAKPPFMQLWFWVLIVSIIGFLVWQYFQNRTEKLELDKERLSSLVEERTAKIEKDKQIIEKQAEKLTVLNRVQNQFFTNITHEFRTPLTLVIGPLQQLRKEKFPKKTQEQHAMMLKNAQHLETLINQLLDLSKLESGKMQLEIAQGDLAVFTKDLVSRFQGLAQEKNQVLHFYSTETTFETHFDREKWSKIIYNLVSNAIKFTPVDGNIQVDLIKILATNSAEKGMAHLLVQDTGVGIRQQNMANIFNRFYQIDGSTKRTQEGSGIGLALVKELVELQGGEIIVHSQVGKGTSFEVKLPLMSHPLVSNNHSTSDVIPEILIPIEKTSILVSEPIAPNNSILEVLIIEDNADMRQYIQSCLEPFNYRIRTAYDGLNGIEKALDIIPDLIISDIMMPRKDGYEVVTAIRENTATSHVPIILLTAKSSLESRLEGLERGADAYLTKPFSPELLLLRIRKLIELRQLIQTRYQKGIDSLVSASAPMLKKEDEFMQELHKLILSNLTNDALSSEWLAQQHFMSRTNFYKKVKALTSHTVGQFINIIRLQEAKKLMKMGNDNMTSISYQVGFSSPSQFSKVCKRILGKSPSEYMESLND